MRTRVRQVVEEKLNPISLQVETSGEIPQEIVERMRVLGLFGLSIPQAYGGLGLATLEEILRNKTHEKEIPELKYFFE